MRSTTTTRAAVVVMVLMVAAASAAAAAGREAGATPLRAASAGAVWQDPDRAHSLYVEATALLATPKQWRRAARLFERSADLRDAADPETYMCLVMAGRLRASVGDVAAAKDLLERAGDHALARGAVVEAAEAYIDAAHAAAALRQAAEAHGLRDRALLLADSPLLSEDQRSSITRRLRA